MTHKLLQFLSHFSTQLTLTVDSANKTFHFQWRRAYFIISKTNGARHGMFPTVIPINLRLSGTEDVIDFQISEFVDTWKKFNSAGPCILQVCDETGINSTYYRLDSSGDVPEISEYPSFLELVMDAGFHVDDPDQYLKSVSYREVIVDLAGLKRYQSKHPDFGYPEWTIAITAKSPAFSTSTDYRIELSIHGLYERDNAGTVHGRNGSVSLAHTCFTASVDALRERLKILAKCDDISGFILADTPAGHVTIYDKEFAVISGTRSPSMPDIG